MSIKGQCLHLSMPLLVQVAQSGVVAAIRAEGMAGPYQASGGGPQKVSTATNLVVCSLFHNWSIWVAAGDMVFWLV